MNNKIFIEYENPTLSNLSKKIYDIFLENKYDVVLLDNNISFNEKENIIKESKNKNIIIANKLNDNNTVEIVYSLRNNNLFAISLNDSLSKINEVSKYYQKRDFNTTNLDYYKILRDINNNESIIIFYPSNIINNIDLPNIVYQGITNYLNQKNIYTVKSGDSLYSIARKFNTTVDDIKRINNLVSNNLSIGQKLIINQDNQKEETIQNNPSSNIYTVKSGDSLYAIARKFNTTVDDIKRLNNLVNNNLSIGQKLIINQDNNKEETIQNNPSSNIYTVKSGDSLYAIARKFNTTVDDIKRLNNLVSNNLSIGQKLIINSDNIGNVNNTTYIVKSGDSLYAIARKFNTTVDDIKRLNNLTSNNLSIGQKLIIPS